MRRGAAAGIFVSVSVGASALVGSATTAHAATDAASYTPRERVLAAVVRANDIPEMYQHDPQPAVEISSVPTAPVPCLTTAATARADEPKAQIWAASTIDSSVRGDAAAAAARLRRLNVQSSAWRMNAKWDDSPARAKALIDRAANCADKTLSVLGDRTRVQVRSVDTTPTSTTQVLQTTSLTSAKAGVVVTSWRVVRRIVIANEVTLGDANQMPSAGRIRAAIDLADELTDRGARRVLRQADVPEPVVKDRPLDAAAGSGLPAIESPDSAPGEPWVVSLGDSYISGEAGAWAGNVENSLNDKLVFRGHSTYFDAPGMTPGGTSESKAGCHRSDSAAIHIGVANSKNLACSGATAQSKVGGDGWKPGIDFAAEPNGKGVGQAKQLQDFATDHQVKLVALSIGGNDFDFAPIVTACVKGYLFSSALWPKLCSKDPAVLAKINDAAYNEAVTKISSAIKNVRTAMTKAGYTDDEWALSVQNYPSVIPMGGQFRYWQTIFRQSDGGCGFWDADADWANRTLQPRVNAAVAKAVKDSGAGNVHLLDMSNAFAGHRLCDKTVKTAESLKNATLQTKFDSLEWVMQVRAVSDSYSDADQQESLHPNYFGQLAERNCLRQMYRKPGSAACVQDGKTLTADGEPPMRLARP